jgi:hypothetical protein
MGQTDRQALRALPQSTISRKHLPCYSVSRSTASFEIFYHGSRRFLRVGVIASVKIQAGSNWYWKPSFPFISLHLSSFPFRDIVSGMLRNSANGHDLLIKYSERSDLDNPYPPGVLNGKSRENELFSLFFIFFVQNTPSEGYYYT